MGIFSSDKNKPQYGAIFEIGSGSVLVAIIESRSQDTHPHIIWAKRETSRSKYTHTEEGATKDIITALMNAALLLDSEGRKVLKSHQSKAKITHLQVSIAAPWSYTVTKKITYKSKEPFTLTKEKIKSLVNTAYKKLDEEVERHEKIHDLGLEIISTDTYELFLNGYSTKNPENKTTTSVNLNYVSSVSQEYLVEKIKDINGRILPRVKSKLYSFMLIFHKIMREQLPHQNEYCLVDITNNATEIGIVREGVLQYCTHIPIGAHSLVYLLSNDLKLPFDEVLGYIRAPEKTAFWQNLSGSQKENVDKILLGYQKALADLFRETGDGLTIPKLILVHSNHLTEQFFDDQLEAAAKMATLTNHTVRPVTQALMESLYSEDEQKNLFKNTPDTALLIAAQFFHTARQSDHINR